MELKWEDRPEQTVEDVLGQGLSRLDVGGVGKASSRKSSSTNLDQSNVN